MIRLLRQSDWLLLAFFLLIAVLAPFFPDRPHLHAQPLVLLVLVSALLFSLGLAERHGPKVFWSRTRDWVPIFLTLVAFQEMDFFQPLSFPHRWEPAWIAQDRWLLGSSPLQPILGALSPALPFYLETCYFLVYGIAGFCMGILYLTDRRVLADRFYLVYLSATLGTYLFFPFFPSEPPRFLYPDVAMPSVITPVRTLNLFLLRKATIHVSVFPSAHVSAAFAAAWAMIYLQPKRRIVNSILFIYAVSVAVATVYGRYHYAADAVAGCAISCLAFALCVWFFKANAKSTASLKSA